MRSPPNLFAKWLATAEKSMSHRKAEPFEVEEKEARDRQNWECVVSLRNTRVAAAIVLAAAWLSGPSVAAEPSYEDLLALVKSGRLDIDYTALRLSFASSPLYDPYGGVLIKAKDMISAYGADDCTAAIARAKEILEINFVQMDAHIVTGLCLKKAGDEDGARKERVVYDGLFNSVLKSGDGKTPQTAFSVISINEEYKVLAASGLVPVTQALVHAQGSSFDRFDAKTNTTGDPVTLYFNVDRMLARLSQTLQQGK